jgi:hypothetical protein
MGVGGQLHAPAALPRERHGNHCIFLVGPEMVDPFGIRSPNRPARRRSLHRLSYPGLHFNSTVELQLSERWLSGLPIIWIGLALRVI